jgi:hypothetical protein
MQFPRVIEQKTKTVQHEPIALPTKQPDRLRGLKIAACSLLIVLVLYGDGLAILSEFPILHHRSPIEFVHTSNCSGIAIGKVHLTLPRLLFAFFNGGGVFNAVPDNNIEFAIYGRRVGADPKLPWEDLNYVKQCFPYECRGEIYVRFGLSWHELLGAAEYKQALQDLATKIKKRYNREHPYDQIDKVAIYEVWWPRSEDDFYKLRTTKNTGWMLLAQD